MTVQSAAKRSTRQPEVRTPAPVVVPEQTEGVLPLADIRPCPFNFRKQFPADDIAALAQSIQSIGLKDRLLVRPIGTRFKPEFKDGRWNGVDHFELADGERRYRALKLAGVENVPVVVRIMTDAEVRAVMIASREQSRDLLPSELAAGYAALVADGKTLEAIAGEVGESVGHVRSVLALVKLPAAALKAVDEGKLPRRTAELIARVPGDKARAECAAWVVAGGRYGYRPGEKPPKGEEPLTYRETGEFIARHFQIELKTAAFNRKALDLVGGVGSCDECPKMAGNAAKTDDAYKSVRADMCLDPVCFNAKTEAHNKLILKTAKETGKKVLSAKESAKLFPYGDSLTYGAEYVDLGDKCHLDGGKGRAYKTLLKDVEPEQVVVALDREGTPHELVKKEVAEKVLKTAGVGGKFGRSTEMDPQWQKQERVRRKKAEAGKRAAMAAIGTVAAKCELAYKMIAESPSQMLLLLRPLAGMVAREMWADATKAVAKRRKLGDGDARTRVVAEASNCDTPAQAFGLLAELVAARLSLGWGSPYSGGNMSGDEVAFWRAFGVDRKELVATAQAEQTNPPAKKAAKPEKVEAAKQPAKAVAAKPSKNGHKPGCTFEEDLRDGFLDGLPRKLTAKSLASIEGFPPALAAALAVEKTTTDVGLSERANKEKGSHRDKIKAVLSRVLGTYEEEVERGTEAFMDYLYTGRKAKQLKAEQAAPKARSKKTAEEELEDLGLLTKRTAPPVTQPVGDLKLRDVPGFPSAIATKFENVSIRTLADLEPKVALYQSTMFAGRPMAEVVYQTIVRTTGSDSFNATAARDALMKHLQPGWTPRSEEPEEPEESPPSKSTRKEKVKS